MNVLVLRNTNYNKLEAFTVGVNQVSMAVIAMYVRADRKFLYFIHDLRPFRLWIFVIPPRFRTRWRHFSPPGQSLGKDKVGQVQPLVLCANGNFRAFSRFSLLNRKNIFVRFLVNSSRFRTQTWNFQALSNLLDKRTHTSLKRRMERFSLANLVKVVFDAYAKGISLFNIVKTKNQKLTI